MYSDQGAEVHIGTDAPEEIIIEACRNTDNGVWHLHTRQLIENIKEMGYEAEELFIEYINISHKLINGD